MTGIGARIKLARKMARMSQRDLAEHVGLSPMAISKYENDKMMPSSDILIKLAKALGVRMEFFLRRGQELEIEPAYRKHSRMSVKAESAVIAEIQEWLERYLAVESLFPHGEIESFSYPDGFSYTVHTVEEAEEAANQLREVWSLGEDPIDNLTELLEARGIKVGLVDGDNDFTGCTFWVNDEAPVIAIKKDIPGDRERFTLAHELGHIMLDVQPDVDEEKAAYRFAGAFLVPADAARRELGDVRHNLDPYELYSLKGKYGMSMGAWVYRAKDLGILSEAAAKNIWREFSQRGWRKQEPGEPPPTEEPQRMTRLIRRLVAEDIISESRGYELLGITLSEYLKQYEGMYEQQAVLMRD